MPFGGNFDGYYKHVIKPAVEQASLRVKRGDEIFGTGPIITDIWNAIWKSRVIVADVTGKNANVNYELGLAHALGVPTILLTQNMNDVPFDYRHRRCIVYNTADAVWQTKLSADIVSTIETILRGGDSGSDLAWPYETRINTENVVVPIPLSYSDMLGRGADAIRRTITRAFGPHGALIPIGDPGGTTVSTRHGILIARSLKSANRVESLVMEHAAQVANLVNAQCGDGSKTALLLFQAFLLSGISTFAGPHRRRDIVRAMDRAIEVVISALDMLAQPTTNEQLPQIGTSAAADTTVATALTRAFESAGEDGVVNISSRIGNSTTVSVSEGMQIDRGFLSEQFINNLTENTCELTDCQLLLTDYKLAGMRQILSLLEEVARTGKSLVLLADDFDEEMLQFLVTNHIRGALPCVAIKAPGASIRRTALLGDIAVMTGGKAITRDLGMALDRVQLADLGRAARVLVNSHSTAIFDAGGSSEQVRERVELLRREIPKTSDPNERERLHARISNMAGRFATVCVDRPTPGEGEDARYRAQTAMHSMRLAIEGGFTVGGGVALMRAGERLATIDWPSEADRAGAGSVTAALRAPAAALAESSGRPIMDVPDSNMGLNVETGRTEDLLKAGVLDPVRMLRTAVQTAYSQAKLLLFTDDVDAGPSSDQGKAPIEGSFWGVADVEKESDEDDDPF